MVNRTFGAYSAFAEEKDERKDRKGRSILNATDEMANPYGLILSEQERDFIYGKLQTLDNWTNSLLGGRTGWRPQVKAALIATVELATAVIVAFLPGAPLHPHIGDGPSFVFFCIGAYSGLHWISGVSDSAVPALKAVGLPAPALRHRHRSGDQQRHCWRGGRFAH